MGGGAGRGVPIRLRIRGRKRGRPDGPLLEYAAVGEGWTAAVAAERRAAEEAGCPSAHCRAHAFGARAPCFLAGPKDAAAFGEAAEACARLGALLRHREHLFFEGGGAGDSFQERLEKLLRLPAAAGKEAFRLMETVGAAFPDRTDEAIAVLRHDACAGVLCSSALGTIGPSPLFWVPIETDAPYPDKEDRPCSN